MSNIILFDEHQILRLPLSHQQLRSPQQRALLLLRNCSCSGKILLQLSIERHRLNQKRTLRWRCWNRQVGHWNWQTRLRSLYHVRQSPQTRKLLQLHTCCQQLYQTKSRERISHCQNQERRQILHLSLWGRFLKEPQHPRCHLGKPQRQTSTEQARPDSQATTVG